MDPAQQAVLNAMVKDLAALIDALDQGPTIDEDDDVHFDNEQQVLDQARRIANYRRNATATG